MKRAVPFVQAAGWLILGVAAVLRPPRPRSHDRPRPTRASYMPQQYFTKLVNVPYKAFLEIGEGTHTVLMEKNRMVLFRGVQAFLDGAMAP